MVSLTALAAMTEGVRTTVLSHGRGGGDEADGGMVYGSDIFTETAPSEIVIAPSEIAHESEEEAEAGAGVVEEEMEVGVFLM